MNIAWIFALPLVALGLRTNLERDEINDEPRGRRTREGGKVFLRGWDTPAVINTDD